MADNGAESGARRDRATTAEKLKDEAVRLFWEKGYAATTTREIAESLGVQRASLYYHIKSKEDLLYFICVESLNNIHTAVSKAISALTDPLDRVEAMIEAHVVSMLADREKHATMLTELRSLSDLRRAEIVQLRDEYESLVRSVLEEAQDAGVLWKGASAKELELALLNLLNWTIFWYRPNGELSPEDLAGLFKEVYLGGVART
ncbi:Transcriptional regulator [Rubrobacter radiotolerans]|uniref:Transcriptional regulator n=1 Tax=Rubrobacter radiotolerans TaxID=42256 RepID=A0A023X6A8_RUBRA|nr:TetR/AcrR family transcriptional regulator [Rubrobacter radiotolerans]AHY47888.1 Transcriptional regulator [Rubrobacter radiotolerans]MDX5892527.1 TetR/AcrR family transcriptional regulator [Rubrobacter radiotolerans]SMC07818.1 transcriptional regulator, TetR family [Rubrobacter radiotolerans DSM 5868]